jgi:hypothetical protein
MNAPNAPLLLDDPALSELRFLCDSDELVLFVGAGLSMAAGLPSWSSLVERSLEYARRRRDDPSRIAEMEDYFRRSELIDALTVARQLFGGSEFGTFVERQLTDEGRSLPLPLSNALSALAPRLRAVLTTNLDHLLERTLNWPPLWEAKADLVRRRRFILKLHGTLLDRDTWVFTRDQYDQALWKSPVYRDTLFAFFHACPLLFAGFGMVDDDFEPLFSRIRALAGNQPPRHFALVPQGRFRGLRRSRLEQAGIRLIEYPNRDGQHADVATLLQWLASGDPHRFPEAAPAPAGP